MTKSAHKWHDSCHADEYKALMMAWLDARVTIGAHVRHHILPWLRHMCGPWCMPPDTGGPVRMGRRGEPVSKDLGLSPEVVAMLARLRARR